MNPRLEGTLAKTGALLGMFSEEEVVRSHKPRLDAITNIVLLAFIIIVSRLWYLQLYKGKELYEYSVQNRLRKEIVKAPRGMIFLEITYS